MKAGDVKLEASITTADGKKVSKYCDIYVHLVDGVYYIKNMNSGYCLEVPDGTIRNYTKVAQAAQYSSTTSEVTRLRQMWKVRYMENGSYSIRPLHNAEMGLYWGGNLMVWNIGTDDNVYSTPKNAQWTINWDGSGYVVKQHGDAVTAVMQVSGASKSEGANIVTGANAANANCRWTFSKITNVPSGVVLYDTSTGLALSGGTVRAVAIDETKTLDDLRLKAVVYSGDFKVYGFTWHLSNLSYDEYVDIDSVTGEVVGLAENSVTVTVTSVLYNGPKAVSYTLKVIPFLNGTYFIKNREFGKYLQIDDSDESNGYITSGAIMEQWAYDGGDYQKWELKSLDNGYYKILSNKSGLALSVPTAQDDEADIALVQRAYIGDLGQQWKITLTENGSYKIYPRSSNDYVMAVGDYFINDSNGVHIEQRQYVENNSYKDEWYLGEQRIFNATVNIYYDMGYCVRYKETVEEAERSIREYMGTVAKIFEQQLGLHINYQVSFYNSPIDQCKGEVTLDNIDTLCEEHTLEHTNKDTMMSLFMKDYPGSSTETTPYWTGHRLSLEDGIGNGNRSCSWYNSVFLLGIATKEIEREGRSHRGLLHELCHQYGAPDHYHESADEDAEGHCSHYPICSDCGDTTAIRPGNCVMGIESESGGELLICDGCYKEIIHHLVGHHE